MKDRVRQVMDHYNLSQKEYADALSISAGSISSVLSGRTAPTNNLIQAIHKNFPAVNVSWLMFGEGDMLLPLSGGPTVITATQVDGAVFEPSPEAVAAVGQNFGFFPNEEPTLFDDASAAAGTVRGSGAGTAASGNGAVAATGTGSRQAVPAAQPRVAQPDFTMAAMLSELKKANENDKPLRRIKEIRVFYDDGTYEAFVPSSK